eukprot:2635530-Lingulodinium_polyedra.AAC.1
MKSKLLLMDQNFKVELAVFDLIAGDHSKTHFHNKVMACLPTKDQFIAPEIALQNLRNLAATKLYQMCPLSVQGTLDHT